MRLIIAGSRDFMDYAFLEHPFPAEWHIHGKSAGYKRNEVMAQVATHCIIFWNGLSPGSRHMKDIAVKKKLVVEVVDV